MTIEQKTTESPRLLRGVFHALLGCVLGAVPLFPAEGLADSDPLPSWKSPAKKSAVTEFLRAVTDEGSGDFVPVEARIAVFDNDGTLWSEKPLYPQLDFLLNLTRARVEEGQLATDEATVEAILNNDLGYLKRLSAEELMSGLYRSVRGMTLEAYAAKAREHLTGAHNRALKRTYFDTRYQPMLELMALLRQHGFRIYIVTGGGEDFVRSVSEKFYGVPADQVLGTRTRNIADCAADCVVHKGHELDGPVNLEQEKVERILREIGRAPLVAVGNSAGDREMLALAAREHKKSLPILLAHDDAEREFDYGEKDDGIIATARRFDWMVLSIAEDFATVFSGQ